jgi:hypothetical protein
MSVSNGESANATIFNAAFVSKKVHSDLLAGLALIGTNKDFYFGDKNTNGSERLTFSAGKIVLQKRIAAVWTDLVTLENVSTIDGIETLSNKTLTAPVVDWVYYGDADTDGTWRGGVVSGNFVTQIRVSGIYETRTELEA